MSLRSRIDPPVVPSVKVDLCYRFCTPVGRCRQALARSGFPSGFTAALQEFGRILRLVAIAPATESGFVKPAVKSTDACFPRRARLLRKVAVVNSYSRQWAGCSPRDTQTRRIRSKFQLARPLVPQPSRATFRPAVLTAAAAFSEVRYS